MALHSMVLFSGKWKTRRYLFLGSFLVDFDILSQSTVLEVVILLLSLFRINVIYLPIFLTK